MPVNSGRRPELPPGGHTTQCPPPVLDERPVARDAVVPAELAPVLPPPKPADPLADEPVAALPAEAALPLAAAAGGFAALPDWGSAGRAVAPPEAG